MRYAFQQIELGCVHVVSPDSALKRLHSQKNSPEAVRERYTLTVVYRGSFTRFVSSRVWDLRLAIIAARLGYLNDLNDLPRLGCSASHVSDVLFIVTTPAQLAGTTFWNTRTEFNRV